MEKKLSHINLPSSEITTESQYLSRRDFLKLMGIVSAGSILMSCTSQSLSATSPAPDITTAGTQTDELGDPLNTYDQITHYNNYYEFSTDKEAVAELAADFQTTGWKTSVGGLVHNPKTYRIDDLLKFEHKERIYRLRCVETWSMVIPWLGFELGDLLREVEPMTSAKFVRFVTLLDPEEMPGQKSSFYPWPYSEGLRLDEATHRLTLIATSMYGQSLPNQCGAPLRLVVPWKYGFKSIKAIVHIELTENQPATLWNTIAPNEYGFYSNVNPNVSHPRWSQVTERRIGELSRRDTLMFNGYGEEVAGLYSSMDLIKYY